MSILNNFDVNTSLNKIKADDLVSLKNKKFNSDEELKNAAKDFESVFLNQLLETMDSTIQRSEMFSGGQAEETFRKMYFQEVAKMMSHSPNANFGLGEMIYKQLKEVNSQ